MVRVVEQSKQVVKQHLSRASGEVHVRLILISYGKPLVHLGLFLPEGRQGSVPHPALAGPKRALLFGSCLPHVHVEVLRGPLGWIHLGAAPVHVALPVIQVPPAPCPKLLASVTRVTVVAPTDATLLRAMPGGRDRINDIPVHGTFERRAYIYAASVGTRARACCEFLRVRARPHAHALHVVPYVWRRSVDEACSKHLLFPRVPIQEPPADKSATPSYAERRGESKCAPAYLTRGREACQYEKSAQRPSHHLDPGECIENSRREWALSIPYILSGVVMWMNQPVVLKSLLSISCCSKAKTSGSGDAGGSGGGDGSTDSGGDGGGSGGGSGGGGRDGGGVSACFGACGNLRSASQSSHISNSSAGRISAAISAAAARVAGSENVSRDTSALCDVLSRSSQ